MTSDDKLLAAMAADAALRNPRHRPSKKRAKAPERAQSITPIEWLARHCAMRGLRLSDAMALFNALYDADAISMANGNVSRAAKIAGVRREALTRRRGMRNKRAANDALPVGQMGAL